MTIQVKLYARACSYPAHNATTSMLFLRLETCAKATQFPYISKHFPTFALFSRNIFYTWFHKSNSDPIIVICLPPTSCISLHFSLGDRDTPMHGLVLVVTSNVCNPLSEISNLRQKYTCSYLYKQFDSIESSIINNEIDASCLN